MILTPGGGPQVVANVQTIIYISSNPAEETARVIWAYTDRCHGNQTRPEASFNLFTSWFGGSVMDSHAHEETKLNSYVETLSAATIRLRVRMQ